MLSDREAAIIREGLRIIIKVCHRESANAGWWDGFPDEDLIVPTKLCLIHSEINEAMEGFRKKLPDDKLGHHPMITVELADALIRIADLAGYLELDVPLALTEKIDYNGKRSDHKREARQAEHGKRF